MPKTDMEEAMGQIRCPHCHEQFKLDDLFISRMEVVGGKIELWAENALVPIIAEAFAKLLDAKDAPNYCEWGILPAAGGPPAFTILVQKMSGETPAAQNNRLKAEMAELRVQLASLQNSKRVDDPRSEKD